MNRKFEQVITPPEQFEHEYILNLVEELRVAKYQVDRNELASGISEIINSPIDQGEYISVMGVIYVRKDKTVSLFVGFVKQLNFWGRIKLIFSDRDN